MHLGRLASIWLRLLASWARSSWHAQPGKPETTPCFRLAAERGRLKPEWAFNNDAAEAVKRTLEVRPGAAGQRPAVLGLNLGKSEDHLPEPGCR